MRNDPRQIIKYEAQRIALRLNFCFFCETARNSLKLLSVFLRLELKFCNLIYHMNASFVGISNYFSFKTSIINYHFKLFNSDFNSKCHHVLKALKNFPHFFFVFVLSRSLRS